MISQFPNLNALCKYVISKRCEAQVDLFLYEHGSAIAVRVPCTLILSLGECGAVALACGNDGLCIRYG